MARDFSKTASNNLDLGATTIGTLLNGAAKISVHAWINPDSYDTANNDNRILSVAIQNGTGGLTLSINNPAGTPVVRMAGRSVVTDGYQIKDGTTNITTGSWWSVGGVNNISGDTITPYVNGAAEGGGAVTFGNASYTIGTTDANVEFIGAGLATQPRSNTSTQFDGRIAELAIWTDDIGAAGFAMLAKGFSPLMVRPDALLCYWPLIGNYSPEIDLISGKNATVNGTVAAASHPRIIYPTRPQAIFVPSAAATVNSNFFAFM